MESASSGVQMNPHALAEPKISEVDAVMPTNSKSTVRKPFLNRALSATPHSSNIHSISKRNRVYMLSMATFLTILVTLATTYGVMTVSYNCRMKTELSQAWKHVGTGGAFELVSGVAWKNSAKLRKRSDSISQKQREKRDEKPQYSYSTDLDGNVETFEYTTRPIVNPGGYTIGTLTGYVEISTTPPVAAQATIAPAATPLSNPAPNASPTSSHHHHRHHPCTSSSSSTTTTSTLPPISTSTQPAQFSTSTFSNGSTEVFEYTTRPIVNPGGYTIGTLTGYVPYTPDATTTVTSTPTTSSTTSAATMPPVIKKLKLQKRNQAILNPKHDEHETDHQGATAEYSYSFDTILGSTVTYVKTTRAIVNPGGFTIGSLDGVYVAFTATAHNPPQETGKAVKYTRPTAHHEELRKRCEETEQEAEEMR